LDPTPLQRALEAAPDRATTVKVAAEQEFFCFRLGDLLLGVASENVREVVRVGPLTPLPRTPSFILGVCGHRGEVLPVVDLLRFLGKGEARIGPRTRLLVGIAGACVAAVVADAVAGMRRIPTEFIMPPPMGSDATTEYLVGVVHSSAIHSIQTSSGNQTLSLVNFGKLIQAARQKAVAR
jgi:purine-binding chemotaxis protein CheW